MIYARSARASPIMFTIRTTLIVISIVLVVLIFEYLRAPDIEVKDEVRPYIEKYLDLVINKSFDDLYEFYCGKKSYPLEQFKERMNYLFLLLGDPVSYDYFRSYIGGVGYFIQYHMIFSNGEKHICSFDFLITKEKQTFTTRDLRSFTVKGDQPLRIFSFNFYDGVITACKEKEGCLGEDS